MTNFRSLIGGFYSSNIDDKSVPVSIRFNNPGAVNGAAWERSYPGYLREIETTPGNRSTVFETPEHGVAVWYELMKKYRAAGATTVRDIIVRYGGTAQAARYERDYVPDVVQRTGLAANHQIRLEGKDEELLKFAKAMFRHEAGKDTPLSNAQILFGFNLARQIAGGPAAVMPMPTTVTTVKQTSGGFWTMLAALFAAIFGVRAKPVITARILKMGDVSPKGGDVWQLQEKLRALGFVDIVVDGEFNTVTDRAVHTFQDRENLDPDGEVGDLTLDALNRATTTSVPKPPLNPPPVAPGGVIQIRPPWYVLAEKDIGFKETGNNRGIERLIAGAKTGALGDAWCAIGINYWLETSGTPGSRSATAQSFKSHKDFIKLKEPTLGAIAVQWRGAPTSWQGHVFLYDGESAKGVRGIGANEDDMVKRSFHDRARMIGYFWPKGVPIPATGKIMVSDGGTVVVRTET